MRLPSCFLSLRILVLGVALVVAARPALAQTRYVVGNIVDDITLIERGTGAPVNLRSMEGKVIFLEWFAWWCPFCQAAASQLGPGIDGYYKDRGNVNGVPVVHVLLNLQSGQEQSTQGFLNAYGLAGLPVLQDFSRVLANRFQSSGQPIFAIINGVAGVPGRPQWQLIYSQLGYGQTQFPVADFRAAIDSVQAAPVALAVVSHPQSSAAVPGAGAVFAVAASGNPTPVYQWLRNGSAVAGAMAPTLTIGNVQPADTGVYTAVATSSGVSVTSDAAILGIAATSKVTGAGEEIGSNLFVASNGNTFDQVLLKGAAAAIQSDFGVSQITRISYVDLSNDIVQVEFSGPGTLSLVLDNPSGPAVPASYNQTVNYMKGHAGIVISGATENTNVSVFSVGRITAVNQALFKDDVTYDGVADIAFIAISSANGKFGGVRTANASYLATKGLTGLYAPGVAFTGPVFIGDINASDAATPVIVLGSAGDTRITGGDLDQSNARAVQVKGVTQLKFVAGQDSHGRPVPAKNNRAVLIRDGQDVTAQVVVNPVP